MSRQGRVCRSGAALLICLLGCATASPILAQGIGGGVLIQTYSFDDAEVVGHGEFQLLTAPFAASVALGPNLGVVASGVWAKGVATGPDGEEITLAGLADTQLGVSVGRAPLGDLDLAFEQDIEHVGRLARGEYDLTGFDLLDLGQAGQGRGLLAVAPRQQLHAPEQVLDARVNGRLGEAIDDSVRDLLGRFGESEWPALPF